MEMSTNSTQQGFRGARDEDQAAAINHTLRGGGGAHGEGPTVADTCEREPGGHVEVGGYAKVELPYELAMLLLKLLLILVLVPTR
jgi:hypothetical protein